MYCMKNPKNTTISTCGRNEYLECDYVEKELGAEMIDRFKRFDMPQTVDQAVDVLLSDLTTQQMFDMSRMADNEFDQLCKTLVPYLQHDFRLWDGNDALLMDALNSVKNPAGADPMRIIMNHLRERLTEDIGVVIAY